MEEEVNGLVTYDRRVTKVDEERMREVNRKLMECFRQQGNDDE